RGRPRHPRRPERRRHRPGVRRPHGNGELMSVQSAVLPMDDVVKPVADGWQLVVAALVGIGIIVVLITAARVHPFLGLILGGLAVGIVAGQNVNDVIESFSAGFGDTAAGVGILIALGAMFAKLLADSGGAD